MTCFVLYIFNTASIFFITLFYELCMEEENLNDQYFNIRNCKIKIIMIIKDIKQYEQY